MSVSAAGSDAAPPEPPGMWQFWNLPNIVTVSGLLLGLATALLALAGYHLLAAATLVGAGIADLFDGFVARKVTLSELERRFGGELDTVADACSFGMAPALLLYGFGLRSVPELALLGFFVWAACWRLAYFNAFGLATAPGGRARYRGLPVTFNALFVPLVFTSALWAPSLARPLLAGTAGVLAVLMVSSLPIPKPRGIWYVLFPLMALVLVAVFVSAHVARS